MSQADNLHEMSTLIFYDLVGLEFNRVNTIKAMFSRSTTLFLGRLSPQSG